MSPSGNAPGKGHIFPGLRPFEEPDAALFFGRDEQVDGLLRRLNDGRFLAIVGLSGSGKSSLVRAGLLPALRCGHLGGAGPRWRIAVMRPGSDPLGALAKTLDDTLGELEDRSLILRSGNQGLLDASREGRGPEDNLLLVVDQFEELFRFRREPGATPAAAAQFVSLLLAAVQEHEATYRVYVVITMRSDYLGEAALFSGLPEALNEGQYLVPRMTREQLREAIEGPAALGGVEVDPGLVELLLDKAGSDPDELPVLQHLLMRMWNVRQQVSGSSRMTIAQFEQVGGWDNALTEHGKALYGQLGDRQTLAKRILQRLTEKGQASRESRRPTSLRELAAVAEVSLDQVKVVVEHFRQEGCNFLTSPDRELAGESLIDISHESLIRGWTDLRTWADEEAESGEWYRRVEDASRLFDLRKRDRLAQRELASALHFRAQGRWNAAWAARYATGVEDGATAQYDRTIAFLFSSQRTQRLKRLGRRVLWIVVVAFAAVVYWYPQILRIEEVAAFRGLRAAAGERDPLVRAQLLAMFANVAGEPELRVYQAAAMAAIPRAVLRGPQPEGGLMVAAFSQKSPGKVTTVSKTGVIRSWRSDGLGGSTAFPIGGQVSASPPEPTRGELTAVSFSPDGQWIAAGLADGSVWVGQKDGTGAVSIATRGPLTYVTALAFSLDGRLVAAGYNDYEVRVWSLSARAENSSDLDATSGAVLGAGDGKHKGPISGIAFDPGGKRVVTASTDGTTRIWDLDHSSRAILTLDPAGPNLIPRGVVYSPDGKWLLCTYDDAARIWPSDGRGTPTSLEGGIVEGTDVVLKGAWFSPDGSRIVTARSDGSAQVWNVRVRSGGGERGGTRDPSKPRLEPVGLPLTLSGHAGEVRAAAFSADATQAITVSADGTARVWWSEPREPRTLGSHKGRVESVAFSSDGKRVVTASDDKTARIWTIEGNAAEPVELAGHADWVRGAAFSPDGTSVVTASEDGTWAIWRTPFHDTFKPHVIQDDSRKDDSSQDQSRSASLSVAFDATGERVVTAMRDKTAKIWNLANPEKPETVVSGHDDWVWSAAFSPDGSRIVTASADRTARIWQVDSGKEIASLAGHADRVLSAAFSPDGSKIVTASADRTARIWTEQAGGWSKQVELRHDDLVSRAAFSADGKWVVSSSSDGTARIWNAQTGDEYLVLPHRVAVRAAAFSPDGSYVVTGSDDGRVQLWRVSLPALVESLKAATTACLDPSLRVQYLGETEKSAWFSYEECEARYDRPRAVN